MTRVRLVSRFPSTSRRATGVPLRPAGDSKVSSAALRDSPAQTRSGWSTTFSYVTCEDRTGQGRPDPGSQISPPSAGTAAHAFGRFTKFRNSFHRRRLRWHKPWVHRSGSTQLPEPPQPQPLRALATYDICLGLIPRGSRRPGPPFQTSEQVL